MTEWLHISGIVALFAMGMALAYAANRPEMDRPEYGALAGALILLCLLCGLASGALFVWAFMV